MKKKGIFFIFLSMLFFLINWQTIRADDDTDGSFACVDSTSVMDCIEKSRPKSVEVPVTAMAPMVNPLSNFGPFGLGARYDTQLGWIPELKYVQIFYDNGIVLRLAYGQNEQRANVTLGHSFSAHQQIKITYEYLQQNLPFDFDSGTITEAVNQNAFGAAYEYLFDSNVLQSFTLNGYYIQANSKNLPQIIFYQNDIPQQDLRRIAGGTEENITSDISLMPFRQLLISLGGGYSHLVYDTQYESNQDTTTIAYNAGLDLLLTQYTKLSANIANSAAERDSSVRISQILPAHIEAAVTGLYSQGQAGQPNATSISFGLSYPVVNYGSVPNGSVGSLKSWIEKPVISAPRVLAIKDEKVVPYEIDVTNPPSQSVSTGNFIQEVQTQGIFKFDSSLFDRVEYSLSLAGSSNTPQSQLHLDLKSDSSSNEAVIYSTAPIPNAATPTGGANVYHVIVTALGYKNGLTQPVQAQADLELDINFNPNNEPQWNPGKSTASISFDQGSAPSSINLNSYLSTAPGPQGVKFSFDGGSYPYWDLKTDSTGNWYLVRKPDTTGAFYAGDINNIPKPVGLIVKYGDDPDGVSGTPQQISVTVNPDNSIKFDWKKSSDCQLNNGAKLPVTQPGGNPFYLDLSKCIQYYDGNGNPLTVSNDRVTFTNLNPPVFPVEAGDPVTVNGNTLKVQAPTGELNSSYDLKININSMAQGSSNGYLLTLSSFIQISNTLTVNSVLYKNTFDISNDPAFITSMVINNLKPGGKYKLIAATIPGGQGVSHGPMECIGSIENPSQYNGGQCGGGGQMGQQFAIGDYLPLPPDSNNQLSIMWWKRSYENNGDTGYLQISSLEIVAE